MKKFFKTLFYISFTGIVLFSLYLIAFSVVYDKTFTKLNSLQQKMEREYPQTYSHSNPYPSDSGDEETNTSENDELDDVENNETLDSENEYNSSSFNYYPQYITQDKFNNITVHIYADYIQLSTLEEANDFCEWFVSNKDSLPSAGYSTAQAYTDYQQKKGY